MLSLMITKVKYYIYAKNRKALQVQCHSSLGGRPHRKSRVAMSLRTFQLWNGGFKI